MAAGEGKGEVVKYLVSRGAKVNLGCPGGSPISAAVGSYRKGWGQETIEYLIKNGATVKDQNDDDLYGSILLSTLTAWGDDDETPDRIKFLVKHGIDVNAKFEKGGYGSALIAAANRRKLKHTDEPETETLECLIELGARVNEQATTGEYGSALVAAVARENYHRIDFLIKHGADVNLPLLTGNYRSALELITSGGESQYKKTANPDRNVVKIINLLLRSGADADSVLRAGLCLPQMVQYLVPYIKDGALREQFSKNVPEEEGSKVVS
ncbi:hypothetical protein TWF481_007851 [Arthrobotrys musiformis]|uniref:Ankyrin n=1 Tax=Arthrobotrys musiformis TaxID=47236 RepID=A0AAV9W6S3_9PEZI